MLAYQAVELTLPTKLVMAVARMCPLPTYMLIPMQKKKKKTYMLILYLFDETL